MSDLLHEVSQSSYKDAINKMAKKIDNIESSSIDWLCETIQCSVIDSITAKDSVFTQFECSLPNNFLPIAGYFTLSGSKVRTLVPYAFYHLETASADEALILGIYNHDTRTITLSADYALTLYGILV